jgi:hypothetical protein
LVVSQQCGRQIRMARAEAWVVVEGRPRRIHCVFVASAGEVRDGERVMLAKIIGVEGA